MNKKRIESFSDGVFSVILTLLVFNFKVPALTSADASRELYDDLLNMHPYFTTYAVSFILVSLFWVAHHKLFHIIMHSNSTLLWINNLFLLFLALVPFPTEVLGAYPETEAAAVFFGSIMVIVSFCFSFLLYYCYFTGDIVEKTVPKRYRRMSLARITTGAALYLIAIIIAITSIDVTLTLYFLIPFLYFIHLPKTKSAGTATAGSEA